MSSEESYNNERLDHLGIVTGVCQEIGLVVYVADNGIYSEANMWQLNEAGVK